MNLIKQVYVKVTSNQTIMRVFHTFWQSLLAVFLVGVLPIFDSLKTGHYTDARTAGIALVVAAVAAGISAVKNAVVYRGK